IEAVIVYFASIVAPYRERTPILRDLPFGPRFGKADDVGLWRPPGLIGLIGEPPAIWRNPGTDFLEFCLYIRERLAITEQWKHPNVNARSRLALAHSKQIPAITRDVIRDLGDRLHHLFWSGTVGALLVYFCDPVSDTPKEDSRAICRPHGAGVISPGSQPRFGSVHQIADPH